MNKLSDSTVQFLAGAIDQQPALEQEPRLNIIVSDLSDNDEQAEAYFEQIKAEMIKRREKVVKKYEDYSKELQLEMKALKQIIRSIETD